MLSGAGVCQAAQPFLAVLLQNIFPQRPLVIVASDLKVQESFQQDIETWVGEVRTDTRSQPRTAGCQLLYYPPWEVLPHEGKLPHADTISDRLQTLVALSGQSTARHRPSAMVVTSVTALLQQTFPPGEIDQRTRRLERGDKTNPLDLIEWLEAQEIGRASCRERVCWIV